MDMIEFPKIFDGLCHLVEVWTTNVPKLVFSFINQKKTANGCLLEGKVGKLLRVRVRILVLGQKSEITYKNLPRY